MYVVRVINVLLAWSIGTPQPSTTATHTHTIPVPVCLSHQPSLVSEARSAHSDE